MKDQETYADKIAKLLRKAESTTPEEAELLYAKAQELMTKYAIDEAMINAARKGKNVDPIAQEEFVLTGIYRFPLADLTRFTLQLNGIKVVRLVVGQGNNSPPRTIGGKLFKQTMVFQVVGYKSDLDAIRLLDASLQLQALRAESEWWRANGDRYNGLKPSQKHLQRREFLFAFAEGVAVKLAEATAKGRKAAEEEHGSSSVALVLQSKEMRVQMEFDRLHSDRQDDKSKKQRGGDHAGDAGFEAGRNADVGQPGLASNRKQLRS